MLIAVTGYLARQGSLPKTLIAAAQAENLGNCLISFGLTLLLALFLLRINSLEDLKTVGTPGSRPLYIFLYNLPLVLHWPLTVMYLESIETDGPAVFAYMIIDGGFLVGLFTVFNLLFFAPMVLYKMRSGREFYRFPSRLFDFSAVRLIDPRSLIALACVLGLVFALVKSFSVGDWIDIPFWLMGIYVVLCWRAAFARLLN